MNRNFARKEGIGTMTFDNFKWINESEAEYKIKKFDEFLDKIKGDK